MSPSGEEAEVPAGYLAGFFGAIAEDPRIRLAHVGLYATLIQCWLRHGRANPISPAPARLMKMAKLSARSTYLRYLRELDDYGYIRYLPSFDRRHPSSIRLMVLPGCETGNSIPGQPLTPPSRRDKRPPAGSRTAGENVRAIN